MTQFENPYGDAMMVEERRTSGLAIASLICSLICCIPLLPAIGALLGIFAAVQINANPQKKGMGLAIAGVIIGIVLTLGQVGFGVTMWSGWNEAQNAGYSAIEPGFAGNLAEFKSNFGKPGEAASDAEAQQFIDALENRYGAPQGSSIPFDQFQTMQQPPPGGDMNITWSLEFEQKTVDAEYTVRDQPGSDTAFVQIRIIDPDLGDLVFPENIDVGTTTQPQDSGEEPLPDPDVDAADESADDAAVDNNGG